MELRLSLVAVLLLLSAASTTTSTTAAPAQAKLGCSDKCGNLTIPYPFGMKKDCYLREEFFINRSHTTQSPVAYLMEGSLIVTNISLDDGELGILGSVAADCYNAQGNLTCSFPSSISLPLPYTISSSKSKFYAAGCDVRAIIQGFRGEEELVTGCISVCNSLDNVNKNSCSGAGCCQTNIPCGLKNTSVKVDSYKNNLRVRDFNPCSYAFIVEQGQFNFSPASFKELKNNEKLPMVLNWAIGKDKNPCNEAQKRKDFMCKANSRCVNRSVGYLCRCLPGYEGNPYRHPDGCQDIDECRASNPYQNGRCLNTPPPGKYSCSCHKGYKTDGMNDKICIKDDSKRYSKSVLLHIVSFGMYTSILSA